MANEPRTIRPGTLRLHIAEGNTVDCELHLDGQPLKGVQRLVVDAEAGKLCLPEVHMALGNVVVQLDGGQVVVQDCLPMLLVLHRELTELVDPRANITTQGMLDRLVVLRRRVANMLDAAKEPLEDPHA